MPDVARTAFVSLISAGKVTECIAALEEGLRAVRKTPYHCVLKRGFLHHAENAAAMIVDFYRSSRKQGKVDALYFEMNGFAINPGLWFCNGFGYKQGGDLYDVEWLANWDYETDDNFALSGMEKVQAAFKKLYLKENQRLSVQIAAELTEFLVIARFNELICAAHQIAKRACKDLKRVHVYSTAHDLDDVCPSE